MRRALIVFAGIACLSVVTASPAADQESRPPTDAAVAKALEMAEDLEIMGAVLRTAFTEIYSKPQTQSVARKAHPSGWRSEFEVEFQLEASAVPSVGRPEGAYLDGYGVVYQVTLDVPAPERRSSKDTAENGDDGQLGPVHVEILEGTDVLVIRGQKADVDRVVKIIGKGKWKDAARRLRGDPPPQPPFNRSEARQMPTADDLVEKLLGVLAENARNFRHLKSQDRLSVAITFPRGKAAGELRYNINSDIPVFTPDDLLEYAEDLADPRNSHEVSGDLHMRAKNYQKAVEAYRKAVEPEEPMLRAKREHPRKLVIARKLAGAYLAAGDLKKAMEWM
ncbi:MAG: tetratricopeptide repeat protein, partial [Planctomycetota bacterium]